MQKTKYFTFIALFLICLFAESHPFRETSPSGGKYFFGGPYCYLNNDTTAADFTSYCQTLSQYGFTMIHIAVNNNQTDPTISEVITACQNNGLKIVFEAIDAYFYHDDTTSELEAKAAIMNDFYNDYHCGTVRAYNIKEEAKIEDMPKLKSYVQMIKNENPNIPLYMTFTKRQPDSLPWARDNAMPLVVASGLQAYSDSDRYYLWGASSPWLIAKERFELSEIQIVEYTGDWGPNNVHPVAIISGTAYQKTCGKFGLMNNWDDTYGSGGSIHYYNDLLSDAQANNNGWSVVDDTHLNLWRNYRPPENAMANKVWVSVATGYRSVFAWCASPGDINRSSSWIYQTMWRSDAGRNVLEEFGDTVTEMQQYGWIINTIAYRANWNNVTTTTDRVLIGNFQLFGGFTGRISVVVNCDVGLWDVNNAENLRKEDSFHINNSGNNIGCVSDNDYTPLTSSRSISLTKVPSLSGSMWDVATGTEITNGSIDIYPGRGKFIFIGSQTELNEIRSNCGY